MEVVHFFSCIQQLFFHLSWQNFVMVLVPGVVSSSLNSKILLPLSAFIFKVVQDSLGFTGELGKLGAQLIKLVILLLNVIQKLPVGLLFEQPLLQVLDMVSLSILNAQMVAHVII